MVSDLEVMLECAGLTPTRANPTDAGLDLRSKQEVTLVRGVRTLVGTGVRVKIPPNYVGFLIPRSSLSKRGIVMTNSIGVIDADYRGEIMASLMFTSHLAEYQVIERDERIVQLVVVPVALPQVLVCDQDETEWNNTARGIHGFGSTGTL